MTTEECYKELGGDYKKMLNTLRSDALIKRFAMKFENDPSFSQMKEALSNDDTDAAFNAAHTLKGVSGNLAFTELYEAVCEITELLRSKRLEAAKAYYPVVEQSYNTTVNAIKKLA